MNQSLSLTPGFSRVSGPATRENRFNGFHPDHRKPLKRLGLTLDDHTRLKPGANETWL